MVQGDTGHMYRWLAGIAPFRELVTSGHVRLIGPSRMARAFPTWFTPAPFGEELRRSSAAAAGVAPPDSTPDRAEASRRGPRNPDHRNPAAHDRLPWGNRSLLLRDPDGNLVNLFTPVTPDAIEKFGR